MMTLSGYQPASHRAIPTHPNYFSWHQALRQRVSATVALPDLEFAGMGPDELGEAITFLEQLTTLTDRASCRPPFAMTDIPGTAEESVWEKQSGLVLEEIAAWASAQADRALEAVRALRPRPGSQDAMLILRVLAVRHASRLEIEELAAAIAAFRADAAADQERVDG
jgi:hypothetical protein